MMAWYIHPSKQLRDDELPPELIATNRDGSIEQAYVPYNAIERLQAENAKLVDVLHEVEAEAVRAYRCLQQDCVTTTNSSQHFFDKWWHAECELDQLKTENAKLRELVRKYGEYTDQDRCEGCVCKSRCSDGDVDECWQLTEIRELARKLQVEVDS